MCSTNRELKCVVRFEITPDLSESVQDVLWGTCGRGNAVVRTVAAFLTHAVQASTSSRVDCFVDVCRK